MNVAVHYRPAWSISVVRQQRIGDLRYLARCYLNEKG